MQVELESKGFPFQAQSRSLAWLPCRPCTVHLVSLGDDSVTRQGSKACGSPDLSISEDTSLGSTVLRIVHYTLRTVTDERAEERN